jgi:hypothetical protein
MRVPTSSLRWLLGAAMVLSLVACAIGETQTHRVEPGVDLPGSAVRLVTEDQADLHLWVSNQSFEEPSVVVTITIDGVEIVSQRFEVESQHNWILFPLPEQERRYVVVNYWTYPGRAFSWHIESTPVGFD